MNIIELQDNLKNFSQDQLIKEMQMPSGQVPQFLVLGELDRRKKMMAEMQAQKANQPTVAEEAIASAGMPQPEMRQMARSMAPKSSIAQNDGVQQMSDGGVVKMLRGGAVSAQPDGQGGYILVQGGQRISDRRFPNFSEANAAVRALRKADAQPFQVDRILSGFDTLGPAVEDAPSGIASIDPDPMAYAANDPVRRSLQQRQAAGTREDPSVGGISSIEPLGRRFMDEYRADTSGMQGIPSGGEGVGVVDNLQTLMPAYQQQTVIGSLPEATSDDPSISTDESTDPVLRSFDDLTERTKRYASPESAVDFDASAPAPLETDAPEGPISMPIGNKGGIYSFDEQGNVVGGNQSYAARFGFTPSIDEPVMATQEAIDSAEEAAKIREEQGITDASGSVGALLAAGDEAAAQEIIEKARKVSKKDSKTPPATTTSGIEEFVEAEKRRPFTPTTVDDDTPKPPSAPRSGGSGMSDLESEIAQMLKDREKSAEQDKWMALAQTGLALMASKQPTLGGALGEAGMAGLKDLRRSKSDYQKDKLSLMTLQQRMEQARMTNNRLAAAANRKSVPKPKTASELNAALDYFRKVAKDESAVEKTDPITGEKTVTYDESLIPDDVKEILFDLEEQYKTMFNPAKDMTGS